MSIKRTKFWIWTSWKTLHDQYKSLRLINKFIRENNILSYIKNHGSFAYTIFITAKDTLMLES